MRPSQRMRRIEDGLGVRFNQGASMPTDNVPPGAAIWAIGIRPPVWYERFECPRGP